MGIKFNWDGYKNSNPDSFVNQANSIEVAECLIEWVLNSLKNTPEKYFQELKAFQPYISPTAWCKFALPLLEHPGSHISDISVEIKNSVNRIHRRTAIINAFSEIEHLMARRIQPECCKEMFEATAIQALELTGDNRYKLVIDFPEIYFSNDLYTHRENIKKLTNCFLSAQTSETKRIIIYLIVLTMQRMCILSNAVIIDNESLSDKYSMCFEEPTICKDNDQYLPYKDDDEDYEEDDQIFDNLYMIGDFKSDSRIDIPTLIQDYNCPEIISIFDPNYYYYDGRFLRNIHEAAKKALENNKYSTEKEPIISQNLSFCLDIC